MGNTTSTRKVNFEDIQYCIKHPQNYLLINTLESHNQGCLIQNTVSISKEEQMVNHYLKNKINVGIIVYDKNANAPNLMKKYDQLVGLGFVNVFIYPGGLFEWLLLQDIYGTEMFPTTSSELDILKYKGKSVLTTQLLTDID